MKSQMCNPKPVSLPKCVAFGGIHLDSAPSGSFGPAGTASLPLAKHPSAMEAGRNSARFSRGGRATGRASCLWLWSGSQGREPAGWRGVRPLTRCRGRLSSGGARGRPRFHTSSHHCPRQWHQMWATVRGQPLGSPVSSLLVFYTAASTFNGSFWSSPSSCSLRSPVLSFSLTEEQNHLQNVSVLRH